MNSVLPSGLDHPDLFFSVHKLNDTSNKEYSEQKTHVVKLVFVFIRKDEARDGSRLVDEILLALFLNSGDLILSPEPSRTKPSVDMEDGIADEVVLDETQDVL